MIRFSSSEYMADTKVSRLKWIPRIRHRPDGTVQTSMGITVAPIPYDRFPGEAPREEHTRAVPGARTALEGRVITQHRRAVQLGVEEENADGRIADMDAEGRDIDFIFLAFSKNTFL